MLGALLCAPATAARAQSPDPFEPALQDPRNPQQFNPSSPALRPQIEPEPEPAPREPAVPIPPAAGETGFDSTGSFRTRQPQRLRPGERHVGQRSIETRQVPPARGEPPQETARPVAPQHAARAVYADAYRPPDYMAPSRRPPRPEVDAFEPVGVRVGSFVLRPAIEVAHGRDTNAARIPGGRASQFTTVAPELQARSDWSRHELGLDLRGSYSFFQADSSLNRPAGEARLHGRIDASRDTRFDLEGRAGIGADYPGSPNVDAAMTRLPVYTAFGGTFGVAQSINRLELSARGLADRIVFRDSELTDGSTFSNRDRTYNQYGGAVRAAYEVTPGFRPFVEFGADRRVHDQTFDRNGFRRDSRAITPRVGAAFETGKLSGELSVGYLMRDYQDPALRRLHGVVADGSLAWRATGLTTATLTASSRADESVVAGVSGALRRDAGLKIDHAFRRWLIGTVHAGYGIDSYVGLGREDRRTSLGVALTYKLSREFWLKGEFRQEWMRSNVPDAGYDASIFLIGMRLQR